MHSIDTALDFPKPPLLCLDHYLTSGRAMQNSAWQRIHQSVAASATSHEITRSKHEHELHTTPCKLLKCCPNRPHPSSARKTYAKIRYCAIYFSLLTFIAAWAVQPEHVSSPFLARPSPFFYQVTTNVAVESRCCISALSRLCVEPDVTRPLCAFLRCKSLANDGTPRQAAHSQGQCCRS